MSGLRLDDIRINVVIVVFVIVLGLALALQYFTHRKLVIEPIYQAFANIEGVIGVDLAEQDDQIVLTLALAEVEQLDMLAAEISSTAAQFAKPLQIIIKDKANQTLKAAYDQMHFAVEQGIATGYFVEMAERIEQLASEYQIKFTLKVDGNYVYLQLHDGDDYLYQIVSRREKSLISRLES